MAGRQWAGSRRSRSGVRAIGLLASLAIILSLLPSAAIAQEPVDAQGQVEPDPAAQTIGFSLPPQGSVGESLPLAVSATSGLLVSFDAKPPERCEVQVSDAGPLLVLLAEGLCHVTASQPGDAMYAPAPDVEAVLDIHPAARPTEPRNEEPAEESGRDEQAAPREDQAESDRAASDQATSDQATSDQATSDQATSDEPAKPDEPESAEPRKAAHRPSEEESIEDQPRSDEAKPAELEEGEDAASSEPLDGSEPSDAPSGDQAGSSEPEKTHTGERTDGQVKPEPRDEPATAPDDVEAKAEDRSMESPEPLVEAEPSPAADAPEAADGVAVAPVPSAAPEEPALTDGAASPAEVAGQGQLEPATTLDGYTCTYDMTTQPGYDATGLTENVFAQQYINNGEVICGGDGRDTLTGRMWPGSTFVGGPGNDTVRNGNMDGVFDGGDGDDAVTGTVYGSNTTPASFIGGPGNDTAGAVTSTLQAVTFDGGPGNDTVTGSVYRSSSFPSTFIGGEGADVAREIRGGIFNGGEGDDSVILDVTTSTYQPGDPPGTFDGGAGNDTVGRDVVWGSTFDGGDGNDRIARNIMGATFFGGLGNDTVSGHVGNANHATGASGAGTFFGGLGNDTVAGSVRYASTFDGSDGDDSIASLVSGTFDGGLGNDTVTGILSGSLSVASTFNGDDGADMAYDIWGGTFNGGEGDDRVTVDVNTSTYDVGGDPGTFNGGAGNDTVGRGVVHGSTFAGGEGNDTAQYVVGGTFLGGAGHDTVTSTLNGTFVGDAGDDRVDGSVRYGTFDGGDGNDYAALLEWSSFLGGAGDDYLWRLVDGTFDGGDGNDTVEEVLGGTFQGGVGRDAVAALDGGTFDGGPDDDEVEMIYSGAFNGGGGDDTVIVDIVDSEFSGGDGADSVLGTVNGSVIQGGAGDDFVERMVSGTFDGDEDFDVLAWHDGGVCLDVEVCGKQAQTISFAAIPAATYGQQPQLTASATSSLPVAFTVTAGPCGIVGPTGDTVRLDSAGQCTIYASQLGNNYFHPADPVGRQLNIAKAPLAITAANAVRTTLQPDPDLRKVTYAGFVNGEGPGVLGGALTCSTTATGQSGPGAYAITCSGLTSPNYEISWVAGTLTVVPATPPSVSAPEADIALGAIHSGKASIPVSVRFGVADSDGVASTRLEHRSGSGAYVPVALPSATATGVTLFMVSSTKTSHRFGAQATDTAGASSPLVEGPAFRVRVFQEGTSGLKTKGSWSRGRLGGAFGGSVAGASKANASQSLTLTASDIAIVSTRGKDRGMARVILDGKAVATIDLYAPATKAGQVVWSASLPTATRHTVALVALGKRSAKAKGTRVDLDAFLALTR